MYPSLEPQQWAYQKNDLLLLDAGIETDDMYTADITRSIPVSGKFTPAQREIYDLVRAAQVAAIEAVQPGNDFPEPHRAAMKVLAEGLGELGLLPSSVEKPRSENQFYKRYTLHGTSLTCLGSMYMTVLTRHRTGIEMGNLSRGWFLPSNRDSTSS